LLDLIRENFGIRWAALAIGTMLVANLGTTIAELAHPDWSTSMKDLVAPHGQLTAAYLLAVVGTVGTITPWGQAFIQSYCVDKRLGPENLVPLGWMSESVRS
jgi:Mn2+/Fe2+ NRAMP family transporter